MVDHSAARDLQAPTHSGSPEAAPEQEATRGDLAIQRLLAFGRPQPREVAAVIAQFPADRPAIYAVLHRMLGNAFANEVLAEGTAAESTISTERSETVEGGDTSTIDRLREQSVVLADTRPAPTPSTAQDVKDLLVKRPTATRGAGGYAAWLVEAKRLGFVESENIMTNAQLGDFVASRPVRTYEYHKEVTPDRERQRKQETNGKLDNATRVPGKKWEWDIDLIESPILETLVAVARARITEWQKAGGAPKVILRLGDFVRADMWFDTSPRSDAPPHEPGTAMDLHFVGTANSASYVLQLLDDLPAIGSITIFRDTDNTLHLDRRAGGYGLGIPAQGDFIDHDLAIDDAGRSPSQAKAETAAGNDHTKRPEARGVKMFTGHVLRSTATWTNGAWKWSEWAATNESLATHLRSVALKRALASFGAP